MGKGIEPFEVGMHTRVYAVAKKTKDAHRVGANHPSFTADTMEPDSRAEI